jgi:hypothetical protein
MEPTPIAALASIVARFADGVYEWHGAGDRKPVRDVPDITRPLRRCAP